MEYKTVEIDSVQAHPQNVRQGDVGAIVESLKAHGQYRPIVVQKSTMNILAGNHTWKAAKALGWKKISVAFVDVDDEQALRILLVDNRANDLATYNDNALAELLKFLADTEGGLDGTGFYGDDLDDLLFRLDGDSGNLSEGLSAAERLQMYEDKGVKTIILPYPVAEWETITERLKELREARGLESNAELVAALVADAQD